MIEAPILLLSANRWDFKDEDSGQARTGTTVHVVHLGTQQNSDDMVGNKPTKFTLDYNFIQKLKDVELPARATGVFEMDFNRNKMQMVDFKNATALNERK